MSVSSDLMLCLHNVGKNTRDAWRIKAALLKFKVAEIRIYKAPDKQHPPLMKHNNNLLYKTLFKCQRQLQMHMFSLKN